MTITQPSVEDYRLPTDVAPRRYELVLSPDLDAATFTGQERVELEILESTSTIVMNAKELQVHSARVLAGWPSAGDTAGKESGLEINFDEPSERVIFNCQELLAPGRYHLECSFSGTLNDKLHGFYRSKFVNEAGLEQVIATTQFEETDARLAFPCFDEPDRKAVFSITLDAPAGMLAVSNGPAREVINLDGGGTRTHFGDTIAMSTYLVAFIVGPLEATPGLDVDGIEVRVIHVPGKGHLTEPALACAAHALRFYRDYFALPYPGEKLDLVGLPDFAAGAMENLGCVTFREAILLVDPTSSSQAEMERMAEVVEHELAHMWFGDLVTMRWWNGIWLNEAFATFMALCCQDDYRPEWQCFVGFSRGKAAALSVDGLHATRPIEFPVHHPDEAAAMFDVLTYQKGATVLWMLERYIGRDAFRSGVRRYLAANQFSNTETTDLWDAIEIEVGELPIRSLMDSWIFQGGYPLISARAASKETIALRQEPFAYLSAEPRPNPSEIGSDWLVPVVAVELDARTQESRVLLGTDEQVLSAKDGPVVLNAGGAGFYRLRYDDTLHADLLASIAKLEATERYNFVADTWAVALSRQGELSRFFDIAPKLRAESDPHVLSVLSSALSLLDLVALDKDRPALREVVGNLFMPILERVGWERRSDDEEPTRLLRSSLVPILGNLADDPSIVARCHELFEADHYANTPIDPDLAASVLNVVVAHASEKDFDAILERYRHPQSPMDEIRHLNCLGALTDAALATRVYELCRSEFRSQNAPFLLVLMLMSRPIANQTWQFISANFDELVARFPENSVHRMLSGVTGLALLDDDGNALLAREVRSFCETRVTGARFKLVSQSLERLDINVAFGQAVRSGLGNLFAVTH